MTTDVESTSSPAETLAARRVALGILDEVISRRQLLDVVLETDPAYATLPRRDRAFTRMLVATTLRRMGQLDHIISKASDRSSPPQPPKLHHLLRLGAAQIIFMAVPDYAVVDTSVRLAEESGFMRQKGFVNAILREITRNWQDWTKQQDAVRLNIPEWLLKTWINDYDLRPAAEIGLASLAEAPLDITIKNPGMADYWAENMGASILPTGTLRLQNAGSVKDIPGFDDGMWWVQDFAAALPARLFGDIKDKTVLDLCAAPGGKTAQLAAQGARVVAIDRSARRLKTLEANLRRLRLEENIQTVAADASAWQPAEKADYILLDAPCTATGTIRRHPDVLYHKSQGDMDRLAALQEKLLINAIDMLKPGGTLIYCTCSLQKAEGESQIEKLLADHKTIRRKPVTPEEVGDIEQLVTPQGDLRCLPFYLAARGGMDGFYVARLEKLP